MQAYWYYRSRQNYDSASDEPIPLVWTWLLPGPVRVLDYTGVCFGRRTDIQGEVRQIATEQPIHRACHGVLWVIKPRTTLRPQLVPSRTLYLERRYKLEPRENLDN